MILKLLQMHSSKELNAFINNAEDYWSEIHKGNSKGANIKEHLNRAIAAKWQEENVLIEQLSPLLSHSSNAIKLAAAAYLIKSNEKEKAVNTLKKLIRNDKGLISPSAAAVLRLNGIVS